ncbi:MAG: hypothetical protein KAT15_05035 [Bacteroidales bacterium]|nr:hypothetical protein [Bacteroidales bacterium]
MYTYERYNFRMFTLLFALVAIIFVANAVYIGTAISAILGILLSFSYQGVQIDPTSRRYLKYDRFLMIRIGQWMPFSTPSYVTIVRINLSSRRTTPSPMVLPQDKKGAKSYKVNLVVDGDERYISVCRGSLEKMLPEALRLGQHMNLRVLDYTTHEKKWIL